MCTGNQATTGIAAGGSLPPPAQKRLALIVHANVLAAVGRAEGQSHGSGAPAV